MRTIVGGLLLRGGMGLRMGEANDRLGKGLVVCVNPTNISGVSVAKPRD